MLTSIAVFVVAPVAFLIGIALGHWSERKSWATSARPGTNVHFTPDGTFRVFRMSRRPNTREIQAAQELKRATENNG